MYSTIESNNAPDDDESDDDDNCDLDEEELSLFRDPPLGFVRMRPSHFRGLPSTVFIEYPPELGIHRIDANSLEPLGKRKLIYRSHWERVCINNAFVRAGFMKTENANSSQWTAMFSKHQSSAQMKDMNCLQKINHFPASWCIGRKDRLLRTINTMRRIHGKAFDFHPEGYILPGEKDAFVRHVSNEMSFGKSRIALLRPASASLSGVLRASDLRSKEADRPIDWLQNQIRPILWITKPVASSCGKGISVMTGSQAMNSMTKRKRVIMQKYLDDPYLIDGKKFDLRIYVLVSGVDPLRVYIHEEGLTRLSTSDYALDNIDNKFAHLTNYSINKKAELFKTAPVDGVGSDTDGFKWSLAAFRKWLAHKESPEIMKRTMDLINDLCLKTMIAAESEITPNLHTTANYRTNCFELFGCDVMLDSKLTPYLLEVNVSPSLMGSSPLDKKIKGVLVADVFHTVGFYPYDPAMLSKFDSETMRTKGEDHSQGQNQGQGHGQTPRDPTDKSTSRDKLGQSGFHSTARLTVSTKEKKDMKVSCNPFAFNSLAKMISSQESWRRTPKPGAIDFSAVASSESSWLLLLMAEDEFARSRSTHFTLVHPTQTSAERYLGLYRNHRFSDHLLARWVSEGGFNGPLRHYIPTRYMRVKDTLDGSPSSKSPSGSSLSTGKSTGKKPLQYEWLEYPVATTSDKNEREKEKELERVREKEIEKENEKERERERERDQEMEKDKERDKDIHNSEKTTSSVPSKKKKSKQVKRSLITLAEWGSGPAPGYLQDRGSSREGRRANTAPERGRHVSMGREVEDEEERGRLQRTERERERVQAEIEEAEILAVITGRSSTSALLDTLQHTHRLPSDLSRSSPFIRTWENTCTYDETDFLSDGWTSLDYESTGRQLHCTDRDRDRDRDRDSAFREHDLLGRTYERVERGSSERKSVDVGRITALTPQSMDTVDGCTDKGMDGESGGDRNRDRYMSFETSDVGLRRSAPIPVSVPVSVLAVPKREEEDRDYHNLPASLKKCEINRQPSHFEDIVFINNRNGCGKYALPKSQKFLMPTELVGNLNGSTGISGKEMTIPAKPLITIGRPVDDHPSRPSSRGGVDDHLHPQIRRGTGTGTGIGTGTKEFLRSISNPPPRSIERGVRQVESKIGIVQDRERERDRDRVRDRERSRRREGQAQAQAQGSVPVPVLGPGVGAANRTEECSTKFSDILAVTGRKDSGSFKNGEIMTYCDTNSGSRTLVCTDISTDRCTDSGLKDRLSINSHTESSSSSSSSGMGAESPYTKAVNRFLDRNSRTSPLENILHGEDSRKFLPHDSLPVMENVPSKSFSRKTRDAIIVSVIKSLDVGKNTDLNRVNSTGSIPNQNTNSSNNQNNNQNNYQNNSQNIERTIQAEHDFYNSQMSLRSISEKIQRNVQESFEKNNCYRRK